jgi:predicted GNAT family acetyltransferase
MPEVSDNAALSRFEMVVGGETAFVTYTRHGDRLTLVHTEVPQALGGRGVGSMLARSVLDDVRRRGFRIVPECEFIAAFIERYPEYAGLVVAPDTAP